MPGRGAQGTEKEEEMQRDVVGFGAMSATHATTTSNAFVRVTTKPVFEGAEVTVECKDGMCFADGETERTLVLVRSKSQYRPGKRVMVDGRLVKIRRRKYDGGRLLVQDEDTLLWHVVEP